MNTELAQVREEIRQADEALVRDLLALAGEPWEDRARALPAFRLRVALGVKVAEAKFPMNPGLFRPLARAHDRAGLDRAITCDKTEAAVLDRVRQAALARGANVAQADRIAGLYRDRVIPETKDVQINRLCELA